jgi:GTP-binding protein
MKVQAQFVTSVADAGKFPPPVAPEIAFLGRSNVGKSSVLNSLIGSRLAHVSSSPGRTQTINFFAVGWKPQNYGADVMLVDLPGYGYARVSRRLSAEWPKFIDPYLKKRANLVLCVVLVDVNVPPQASDRHLLNFLRQARREFIVVGTKSDRLSHNRLRSGLKDLQQALAVEEIFPFSAKTGSGREHLWRIIRQAAAASGAAHA